MKYILQLLLLLSFSASVNAQRGSYTVENMADLNSDKSEFCAVPWAGGVVFTSTRGHDGLTVCVDDLTNERYSDIYVANATSEGFDKPQPLRGRANRRYHDGVTTFGNDGLLMYFSRNADSPNKQDVMPLKILASTIDEKGWSDDYELNFNLDLYSSCHPTLSRDGRVMVFASNRPGGYGGMDLYETNLVNGEWSEPKNLGPKVNTEGNEIFPFLDEQVLYFSSNGYKKGRDLDILYAERAPVWTAIEALPAPINGDTDDFGFVRIENTERGYFSSNRDEGMGGDDIYGFERTPEVVESIPLLVMDEENGERLSRASMAVFPAGTKIGNWSPEEQILESQAGEVYLVRVPTGNGEPKEAIGRVYFTNPEGTVDLPLTGPRSYTVRVERTGYEPAELTLTEQQLAGSDPIEIELRRTSTTPTVPTTPTKTSPKTVTASIELYNRRTERTYPYGSVEITNHCTGTTESFSADAAGIYSTEFVCGCSYEIVSSAPGTGTNLTLFSPDCETRSNLSMRAPLLPIASELAEASTSPATTPTPAVTTTTTTEDRYEVGDRFVLEDLYYDFNKFNIRSDAAEDLDRLVAAMQQYPTLKVELSSHTDSRGSDAYNLWLSDRRAKAAVSYVVAKGIDAARITARGYGETQLTNDCGNGVKCDDAAHQANRRTEVRIVER